jgi:dTMP kinase
MTLGSSAAAQDAGQTNGRGRGAFIVCEGVDRCGKTTQIGLLLKALQDQGIPAEAIRFPGELSAG